MKSVSTLGKRARIEGHRTVTAASVQAFANLTGDHSRMHLDAEYARELHGGPPVAHGLLSASWALGGLTQSPLDPLHVHDPQSEVVGFEIRLQKAVSIGDTLSIRWESVEEERVSFEVLNQFEDVTSRGAVTVALEEASSLLETPPEAWPREDWSLPEEPALFFAEDLMARGPRGDTRGQAVSASEMMEFAREMGELNPRTLDVRFAARTAFGERQVSPMLLFCQGFAAFLESLLGVPLPDAGFAGHVGDSWRVHRRVRAGERIVCRHRPLSCRPSRSRPGLALVEFGLQFLNQQDEVVQDGEVVMMIPTRDSSTP